MLKIATSLSAVFVAYATYAHESSKAPLTDNCEPSATEFVDIPLIENLNSGGIEDQSTLPHTGLPSVTLPGPLMSPDFGLTAVGNHGRPYPGKTASQIELPNDVIYGNWIIGNGGDSLALAFTKAREHAAKIVEHIRPEAIDSRFDPAVAQFIGKYRDHLAWDIRNSEHQWNLDAAGKPTCAWTITPDPGIDIIPTAHVIQLSYQTCRSHVRSFSDASELLIHESCHHFGIPDEETCNTLAYSIIEAWRSGGLDWVEVSKIGAPEPRERHSAVWNGREMIIFGGFEPMNNINLNTLYAYEPKLDNWAQLQSPNGMKRHSHSATSTEKGMIVWGGYEGPITYQSWQYDGAIYDRETDSWQYFHPPWNWQELSGNSFAQGPRQTATWTGTELLIWGGTNSSGTPFGASFNPMSHSWEQLPVGSTAPQRLGGHSAVWTGNNLIIWGGYKGTSNGTRRVTNEGAIYNGTTWLPITTEGAPTPRAGHTAVWTGKSMVVFSGGGIGSRGMLNATGGVYTPSNDPLGGKWYPLSTEIAIERVGHQSLWTNQEILVSGGRSNRLATYFKDVVALEPEANRFRGISSPSAPQERWFHSAVWTGNSMIIWGGSYRGKALNTGGVFFP